MYAEVCCEGNVNAERGITTINQIPVFAVWLHGKVLCCKECNILFIVP